MPYLWWGDFGRIAFNLTKIGTREPFRFKDTVLPIKKFVLSNIDFYKDSYTTKDDLYIETVDTPRSKDILLYVMITALQYVCFT